MNTIPYVNEFHIIFQVDMEKRRKASVALLQEELDELQLAIDQDDKVAILDALTDLQYFLDGTYLAFGLDEVKGIAFIEVHNSNMSKLDSNGRPIFREDGKVLKGPNYFKPNLRQFIQNAKDL